MTPSSGKGPRRNVDAWVAAVAVLAEQLDIDCRSDSSVPAATCRLRLRPRDDHGGATGGTAVLTLYGTGSWTWGGDADVVAYAYEPLNLHGLLLGPK